ncbi:MAG: TrkH family potassium uptake protein [Deltaproteobacteria bacterium]|nr:TrkH family potassium uptake protein [Deltaproteobacteria bacterium]
MNIRVVLNFVGRVLIFIGIFMILPVLVSLYYKEDDLSAFLIGVLACTASGIVLVFLFYGAKGDFRHREGFLFVTLSWVAAGFMGAIPFKVSGYFTTYMDALFETISGFTTTGASILIDIEMLPHGLLLWRSLIQWLGGMGIIVLSVAILPFLGVGGMQIFNAEAPGPTVDKLAPRMSATAKLLWGTYFGITMVEIVLLWAGSMDLFDATCHAFTTMATGGFSPRNTSIGSYNSVYVDTVITIFMLIAGASFSLHYAALKGDIKRYIKNTEFRWYISIFIIGCVIVMWSTRGVFSSMGESVRYVTFQVASIFTTTGFATYDYVKWPATPQIILLLLMIVGGCAGSTGGGLKVMRLVLLIKYAYREILRLVHPNAVVTIKLGRNPVSADILRAVIGFSIFYILIFVLASVAMSLLGLDFETSLSSVIACMSNIGPGLAHVGPMANYAQIPYVGKLVLTFCMLVGRLEIYTVLVVLSPAFWRA